MQGSYDSFRHRPIVSDIDAYGHVNHGAYVRWLEEGRERFLRTKGFSFLSLAAESARPVLVNLNLDFRSPLAWGEEVDVRTRVEKLGKSSLRFGHEVLGSSGRLLLTGSATMVFVTEGGGAVEAPLRFREAFGGDGGIV